MNLLNSISKVVKNIALSLFIVFVLLTIVYFIPMDTPTGFVVNENSNLDPEVQEEAYYVGEVDVIVKLKDVEGEFFLYENQEGDIGKVKEEIKGEFKENVDLEGLDSFAGKITSEGLDKLERHPNVEYVQIDHIFSLSLQDSLGVINADNLQTSNITGDGIGVCVLDTGIDYSHSDLSENYVGGYDYVNDDADPLDDHGHGTHVSGIVQGVAPNTDLIHIKVLNSVGTGSESDIAAGITWCLDNKDTYNIKVVSMSLGAALFTSYCDSSFPTFTSAVNNAINGSLIVIASSGNDGSTSQISSPGCIENVTAVGATDKSDNLASYGNRNSLVDVMAPGSSINSTLLGGGYTTLSGTSMAAPHVAGAVALMQEFIFDSNSSYLDPYLTESLLEDNGVDVSGYKRIDIYESVSQLDWVFPSLVVDSPISQTYSEGNISLNYSASDLLLESVYYNLNGTNVTLSGNITLNLEGGSYILSVYAVDGNFNLNSTSVNFSIGGPSVVQNIPVSNYNDIDGTVDFDCSFSSGVEVTNLSLWHDASGTFELNQSVNLSGSSGNNIFSLSFSDNQTLIWNCLGFDSNNEFDWGGNRTLRINVNSAPVIDTKFPNVVNVNVKEPNDQVFNISSSDLDNDAVNVSWYLNSYYVSGDNSYTFNGDYNSSGNYSVLVLVSDDYDANDSFVWEFSVANVEYCGDDVKNSTEECDGSDFGGLTCNSYGFDQGSLSCGSCSISSSGCSNSSSSEGDSGGSSGGGGGDSGGDESLVAFSDVFSGSNNDNDDLGEEVIVDDTVNVQEGQEEPEVVEEIIDQGIEQGSKKYGWLWGILAAVVGGSVILFLLKKEWKVIVKK